MAWEECGAGFHCCRVEQAQVAKQLVTRLQAPSSSLQCFPRAGFAPSLGWRRGRTEADVNVLTQTLLPALPLHWETHLLPAKCLFTGLLHMDTHPHVCSLPCGCLLKDRSCKTLAMSPPINVPFCSMRCPMHSLLSENSLSTQIPPPGVSSCPGTAYSPYQTGLAGLRWSQDSVTPSISHHPVQEHPWLLASSQTHPQDGQTDPPLEPTTLKRFQVLFTQIHCSPPPFVLSSCMSFQTFLATIEF